MTLASVLALAQNGLGDTAENAHKNSYRDGWACDKGFKKAGGDCTAVRVPANGYIAESAPGYRMEM